MSIMPGFTLTDIETSGARIRLRHGGSGPPLLLLHGNPLTHVSWHAVAPRLAEHFHVVAADLRGYGDSSAPPEEPGSVNYSFRAMAQDQVEVMQALGHSRFFVAGHDRGGRTTHRMCLDHPDKVIKAAIIDIVPTLDMWAAMDKEGAIGGWHWPFMAQPADFPERMLGSVPADWFMRKKLLKLTANLNHIPPEIWDEYVRCFNEKTIRGSCADYRAAATIDCELDTADLQSQARDADPGAVGQEQQRRQALRRSARAVAAAGGGRARRGAAERALRQRGGARAGAGLVPAVLRQPVTISHPRCGR